MTDDIQLILDLFGCFREATGGDGLAAALLTLARLMQDRQAVAPINAEPPSATTEPPQSKRPSGQLLDLPEAAAYLGYTPSGLRKIVERSRTKQLGHTTAGVTIKFFQPKKCSDIKFRQEWLDEFVAEYTVNPDDPLPPPFKPRKTPGPPAKQELTEFGRAVRAVMRD